MNKIVAYLQGARAELAKVVWPSRKQTIKYTLEVLAVSAFLAIFLSGLDFIFSQLLGLIL